MSSKRSRQFSVKKNWWLEIKTEVDMIVPVGKSADARRTWLAIAGGRQRLNRCGIGHFRDR